MAVYTEVSQGELTEFLKTYSVGDAVSFKGIAEGVENSNYLLQTTKAHYILTLYEKRTRAEDLPFFLGLMNHLAEHQISCPVPIPNKKNEVLGELSGRPTALISFLEGVSVNRPKPEHCGELGKAMARMHLAGLDYSQSRDNAFSCDGWQELFLSIQKNSEFMDGLNTEVERDLGEIAENWPDTLPRGIIHADLFPDNVFFLDDKISGLIDFYFACTDMLAYDIAICLNAWCFEQDHSFNITKARSLLREYTAVRPLERGEFDALPLLARGAAMRFLLTRLYDYQHTPKDALVMPKDPTEYIKKLRFHRGVTSTREYGLD